MPVSTERTTFSLDVFGRYLANTWQEAMDSADPGRRPDARPFDVIVICGGTFGAAFAQHLFALDTTRSHRILLLEAGPLFLPEHVQNLPMPGVGVPPPTSIAGLRASGQFPNAREEVWGLAWHGNQKFPGLAYCLAGRSLYWGVGRRSSCLENSRAGLAPLGQTSRAATSGRLPNRSASTRLTTSSPELCTRRCVRGSWTGCEQAP